MQISTYKSEITTLSIARNDNAIIAISFSELHEDYLNKLIKRPAKVIKGRSADTLEKQLDLYFSGKDLKFDLELELHGTDFQKEVWMACASIPFGEIRTYGDLAKMIGKPKAVRAVGTALGANPIPIVIPCHRVIGSTGKLTGFAGGIEVKGALLDLENNS